MFLIDVLAAGIRRDMDHMNEDGPPNVYGGDARENGESGGGSDTRGTGSGNGIGHCVETMTTHGREEQKGTDEQQVAKKALTFAFFSPTVPGGVVLGIWGNTENSRCVGNLSGG